ncbi:conjugation TrbI family protein [Rhodomicrobium vannielii ATCC 17100]|uniref:Conjugation TrbI family protein n=1 Tax=Rhodomicrobium vannielii (strain ATCC 17100 / DSM 162 / LMG 4299 / NCIMB 10020 / ATH 3.1.1) TaxID=648757 RepID=E3I348_RHOVT|nr:TrbI/VirB10 family protein [Rhodomicrobium vannielii]ADP70342.1 conjugation TrbI family protein [Rhodomicrobium vannielii ATCC 17100]
MNKTPSSPDLLGGPPSRGAGVRRLNRVPLMIAMAILALIMATIAYTYHLRLQASKQDPGRGGPTQTPIGILANAPDAGYIPPKAPETIPVLPQPVALQPAPPVLNAPDPNRLAWEAYYKRLEHLREAREKLALTALGAGSEIEANLPRRPTSPASETAPLSASEQFTRLAADRLSQLGGDAERERDLNRQRDKRAFLADQDPKTADQNTLKARREAPRSPYEVRAGTVIPTVMIGGVNSDLPGQLLAQVSENVYDTATGRFIVIPQGSKLVGTYDSGITTGQERVLVAWTRIIYPDASSLDLGRMPGADEGGYAGFKDQVNNHVWKIWSNAILLSAFSAGIQLSQGNGNNQTSGGLNATQTIAASTGQQLGQLGQEMAKRNLQIQPTLEVRPGYRFVVQVTKDLILRPWVPGDKATVFFGGYPYRDGVQR